MKGILLKDLYIAQSGIVVTRDYPKFCVNLLGGVE